MTGKKYFRIVVANNYNTVTEAVQMPAVFDEGYWRETVVTLILRLIRRRTPVPNKSIQKTTGLLCKAIGLPVEGDQWAGRC